jgi:hypothetical protein
MKKTLLLLTICFLFLNTFAQTQSDSLAYQLQRKKINSMLAVRAQKFGRYDQSLSQHTGIFGLQTKKDIRRSNNILMDIVKTDNEIYRQLKILLDYRTFQQTQVLDKSKENETIALNFMRTINRLQNQNEKLKKNADEMMREQERSTRNFSIVIVALIIVLIGLLWNNYRKRSVNNS